MAVMRISVSSHRLLELESATPRRVSEVREMLEKDGLDVKDAEVTVLSKRHHAEVIGDVDSYQIGDRDIVNFDTVEVFAPVTMKEIAKRRAAKQTCCCCGCKPGRVWLA